MVLAPDWVPTGSDGLLAEINFAATWNAALDHPLLDDRTLVPMATTNAAKLVRLHKRLGSLEKGFLADVLVLRPSSANHSEKDSYWTVTHSAAEDVTLVMVGGKALYGDPSIMKQLTRMETPLESIEICGVQKSIFFVEEFGGEQTFHQAKAMLTTALRYASRTLGPLSDYGT